MKRATELFKLNGFQLKRENGSHYIWFRSGVGTIVVSKSKSDFRAEMNNVTLLKRKLREAGIEYVPDNKDSNKIKEKKMATNNLGVVLRKAQEEQAQRQTPPSVPPTPATQETFKQFDDEALELLVNARKEGKKVQWMEDALYQLGYRNQRGNRIEQTAISKILSKEGLAKNGGPRGPYKKKEQVTETPAVEDTTNYQAKFLNDVSDLLSSNLGDAIKEKFLFTLVDERHDQIKKIGR